VIWEADNTLDMKTKKTFGQVFKAHRLALKLSLRQFCETNGFDATNISKIERDLLPPPQKVSTYARALNLTIGSDKWLKFTALSAEARKKKFPPNLREDELVKQLPAMLPKTAKTASILNLLRKR
jgi:transcriptional regulator with XRE-family HTH domain